MPIAGGAGGVDTIGYRRHAWPIRLMHWINVLAFAVLLMSGLQIFNAFPVLTWGKSSYTGEASLLRMGARLDAEGELIGVTRIFGRAYETTGMLGVSAGADGAPTVRGFPAWITLPGEQWLAMGRRWHLFFAWVLVVNGLLYLGYTIASGHLARDLLPDRADWRGLGQSVKDHLLFRRPAGEAERRYNVLQKLAYLGVIFVLFPLVIMMGLAMSPGLNALLPGWVDAFGGRQSARTLHFVLAWLIVAFVFIHIFEVVVSGFWNNLRAMVTGRYSTRRGRDE